MKQTQHTTEQMIHLLGEVEAAQLSTDEVCRPRNISGQTSYRWRSKNGGMKVKEGRRFKQLDKENSEQKELHAYQLLKAKALEITLGKNSQARSDSGVMPKKFSTP